RGAVRAEKTQRGTALCGRVPRPPAAGDRGLRTEDQVAPRNRQGGGGCPCAGEARGGRQVQRCAAPASGPGVPPRGQAGRGGGHLPETALLAGRRGLPRAVRRLSRRGGGWREQVAPPAR